MCFGHCGLPKSGPRSQTLDCQTEVGLLPAGRPRDGGGRAPAHRRLLELAVRIAEDSLCLCLCLCLSLRTCVPARTCRFFPCAEGGRLQLLDFMVKCLAESSLETVSRGPAFCLRWRQEKSSTAQRRSWDDSLGIFMGVPGISPAVISLTSYPSAWKRNFALVWS